MPSRFEKLSQALRLSICFILALSVTHDLNIHKFHSFVILDLNKIGIWGILGDLEEMKV